MSDNIKQYDWGYEIFWAEKETYSGKIIAFSKPGITDLQFYKNKNRSWFFNDGNFKIRWIDINNGQFLEANVKPGSTFDVPSMMPVSIECLTSTGSFTEVSDNSLDVILTLMPKENLGG